MVCQKEKILLQPGGLSIEQINQIHKGTFSFRFSQAVKDQINLCHQWREQAVDDHRYIYGVNTGFGFLANQLIGKDELTLLQTNLVTSHCAGVSDALSDSIVRLIMVLKINALAQAHSGVRMNVIEYLSAFYHHGYYPLIPSKGSVGASGDLAPLAALAAPLLGIGSVRYEGEIIDATQALSALNLPALVLQPKEGLALLNGTQVSTAIALDALIHFKVLFNQAIIAGAMSVEAFAGQYEPFSDQVHRIRKHPGQIKVAKAFLQLLNDSTISGKQNKERIQDPYSIRCQPQVMGACHDQAEYVEQVLVREANAVTDNPLFFSKHEVLSAGNFHAEPVAFAADNLSLAISEVGALSERRIAQLTDPRFSGLPAFLVNESGVNSGFMIAHVTAAALASENKALSHPRSVDSISTSANQEDHVSMATGAALRLSAQINNARYIVAIELLAAAQGIELRAPLQCAKPLLPIMKILRAHVTFLSKDRVLTPDIECVFELLKAHKIYLDLI